MHGGRRGRGLSGEDGTASVELVAVVPFLLLAVLAAAQIALAGQDAEEAARRTLPEPMRRAARVEEEGEVSVRVPVPRLLPALPRVTVGARAGLGGGDG